MPGRVYWIQDPLLLGVELDGYISEPDLEEVVTRCLEIVELHPVYLLLDTRAVTILPKSTLKIDSFARLINHSSVRWFAVCGGNQLVKFILQVSFRKTAHMKSFGTHDEAVDFLTAMAQNASQEV